MNLRAALVALAIAVAVGLAAWLGIRALGTDNAPDAVVTMPDPVVAEPTAPGGADVVTIESANDLVPTEGATPMAERVAVVGLLNKRNGETRDITLKPGQAVRYGDAVVRLRACERTAPWEQEQYTGAFVQLDVRGPDRRWRRSFSGWLFKERPSLNVVQHPIYDVWPKSCTMRFPETGPDTVSAAAPVAGGGRSSAPKSQARTSSTNAAPAEPLPAPEQAPSASANSTE